MARFQHSPNTRLHLLSIVVCVLVMFPVIGIGDETPGAKRIVVVLAGDSTVTDESGWGRGFSELLAADVECINLAKSGRSSRSFRAEGWWQRCLDAKPDFLLIQFGHNDQKGKGPARESAPESDFRSHLREFVTEANDAGIQPILITPLTRRRWSADGKIEATLSEYAEATRIVAAETQTPLIDLHALSIRQCELLGATAYRAFEPMSEKGADHTHLNLSGSRAVAPLVAAAFVDVLPSTTRLFVADKVKAATVPAPYPTEQTAGNLHLEETEETVAIRQSGKTVLVYNKKSPPVPEGIDPVYQRSGFLHPVASPAGSIVTATFPADHAHQHGIFTAWVKTSWLDREIDFWNLAGGTGRVLHQRVISTFADQSNLGFEVDLIHRAEQAPIVDILRERWKITVFPTDGTWHAFDLETTQTAITDIPLIVNQYHYGGVAFRGPVRWVTGKDNDARGVSDPSLNSLVREPSDIVNEHGSDRVKGNHEPTRWVSLTGLISGRPVTVSVLAHKDNFRSPQPVRIHPTKPYFVFSPCVEESFIIDADHPVTNRYRYLITDAAPDQTWLSSQWQRWCESQRDQQPR